MTELSAELLAQRVLDLELLDNRQLNEVWTDVGGRNVSVDTFMQAILRREFMTNFQMERLLKGERWGYFYGDYKVLYLVAGGSFARVYRAVHRNTGQVVALKVLRKRYSDDQRHADHFVREGELGRNLRHPNIVPVYEVFSSGLQHYLVMEFVEGSNLREFTKVRGALEPLEATDLIHQVVSGLRYAAERGCMHRDLKLTNILISTKRQAKLVDFGLAATDGSEFDDASGDTINQRTIDYAGLERATGVRSNDPRSDIFFAGCIYYNMLWGKPALLETRDRIQRLSRARYADVTPLHKLAPHLPRTITQVVAKAMEFDPEKRYQTLGDMLVDLEIAMNKLKAGEADDADDVSAKERERAAAKLLLDSQRRAVMVIESSVKMQDSVRTALKSDGYRALIISDPERGIARFEQEKEAGFEAKPKPADCVIFGTSGLGEAAAEAFCKFATDEHTRDVPAIFLLDPKHCADATAVHALTNDHRVILQVPFTVRQLREVMHRLVPAVTPGPAEAEALRK